MTAPDPANVASPVDPAAYGPRRPLMGVTFWIVIAFAAVCIVAGVAVGRYGAQLFPPKPAAQASAPADVPAASLDARLADIQARLKTQEATPPAASAEPPSAEVTALSQRVDRLESDRKRLTRAAAAALSAAALSQAAAASRPFPGELAVVEAALPESADLRALRPLAETGAPTLAALAAEYPDAAAKAAVASRARARGTGWIARIAQAFAAIITIRRTDQLNGKGVDAILARAQRKVDDGDLQGALSELSALPPSGRDAMADWRARAERRAEIDRRLASIRASALADLARASQDPGSP